MLKQLKKVVNDGSRVWDPERIPVSTRSVPGQRDRPKSDIQYQSKVWTHVLLAGFFFVE
jgi:hypothetical protein